jgi:hypothetical protein
MIRNNDISLNICCLCCSCVWVWDLVSGSVQHKLVHGSAPLVVPTLSVHPSAPQLLTAAAGFIKLWGEKLEVSDEEVVPE